MKNRKGVTVAPPTPCTEDHCWHGLGEKKSGSATSFCYVCCRCGRHRYQLVRMEGADRHELKNYTSTKTNAGTD